MIYIIISMINNSEFLKPKRKYKKKNIKLSKRNKSIIDNLQNNNKDNYNNLNYYELQNKASVPETFDQILLFNDKIKFEEKKYFMKIKLNIEDNFNIIINEFKIISDKLNNLINLIELYKPIINNNLNLAKFNNIKYFNKNEYFNKNAHESLICHEIFFDIDDYENLNKINLINIT